MDEQEFRRRADAALEDLQRRLARAAEHHDFEPDFNAGALVVEFEEPITRVSTSRFSFD
jgi:frataxin-like iron-binding protein CyaY